MFIEKRDGDWVNISALSEFRICEIEQELPEKEGDQFVVYGVQRVSHEEVFHELFIGNQHECRTFCVNWSLEPS